MFNHHPDANYNLCYGGIGIIVFDMDHGFKFVKRIPTWKLEPGQTVEMIKGIAADAASGRLYVTTTVRVAAFDLATDKIVWEKQYAGGFDRLAISPDGKTFYVPTFEGAYWDVINASNGDLHTRLDIGTGAHNTIWAADGSRAYLAGLHSNFLLVADPKTNQLTEKIGLFSSNVRPFTVNGSNSLTFVNTNNILGFDVGDIRTGKKLFEVAVQGFPTGKPARHNPCQSHGIALTSDEKEIWLADGVNNYLHVFHATVLPPQTDRGCEALRQPGLGDVEHRLELCLSFQR